MTPFTSNIYQGAAAHRKVQSLLHSMLDKQFSNAYPQTNSEDVIWFSNSDFISLISPFGSQKEDQYDYDFVYHRCLDATQTLSAIQIKNCYRSLKLGGQLIIEQIDFAKQYAYPYSAAFARYKELIINWQKLTNSTITELTKLPEQLQKAGFKNIQTKYPATTFLTDENIHLTSLKLESMANTLLKYHLVTADEIHALISELRSFEQAQTTMICTPSIQQVIAQKLKN